MAHGRTGVGMWTVIVSSVLVITATAIFAARPALAAPASVPPRSRTTAGVPSVVLCKGWLRCTRLGFPSYGYASHASTSYWRMYPGDDCTNYSAYVEETVYGIAEPSYLLGDAGQWAATAAAHSVPVNHTPSVGAIAEWNGGDYGMGNFGHVGIVEQVGPKGSYIIVSQQGINRRDDGYQWTLINAGYGRDQWQEWPDNFIHFRIPRRALLGYFTASTRQALLRYSQTGGPANHTVRFRSASAVPLVGHFGTASRDRIGNYDPAAGTFHLPPGNLPGPQSFAFGPPHMIPLAGDWTGAGADGIGYYDPATGTFHLRDSPTPGNADKIFAFGPPHMIPLAGDWTGAGADGIGYYDPATGKFHLKDTAGRGRADKIFAFGPPHMIPLAGDWTGAGADGIGYYDPATGKFHLKDTAGRGRANFIVKAAPAGVTPVTGDWYGR